MTKEIIAPRPRTTPEALYDSGITDLVSVVPPGAELHASSTISPKDLGKVPGYKLPNGRYVGYDWRRDTPTAADVRKWLDDGSSIGLRAKNYPGLDIDVTDTALAELIQKAATEHLGPAPTRTGRAPKRLMMYRAREPFAVMRLHITRGEEKHVVEVLGDGQQYVIWGIHPATQRPYEWDRPPSTAELTELTAADVTAFFDALAESLAGLGYVCEQRRTGGTRREDVNQELLRAPSIGLLREAVECIPNSNELFPGRDDYIRFAVAVRAACGDDVDAGYAIFEEWGSRWEGGPNETLSHDWQSLKPPFSIGWDWIVAQARPHGFNDAHLYFEALEDARPVAEGDVARLSAPVTSHQWLGDRIVGSRGRDLRYVPQKGCWHVWDGTRWRVDDTLQAPTIVLEELRQLAHWIASQPIKDADQVARRFCSAGTFHAVFSILQRHRELVVSVAELDSDPWALNTPAGVVDLRTGELGENVPDSLCTKSTRAVPDFEADAPTWHRFLEETTGGDQELINYLQRLAGYCLTGVTDEHNLAFVWGPGGNGKSVFLNTLAGILGDYAAVAPMTAFTSSSYDRHTTEIAMLVGARLVIASETQAGRAWDEARIKSLTGGDPITARFMRQDNFTYQPQFKLVFAGNHKPGLRDVDAAIRRRIHLVPFDRIPPIVDPRLLEKLKEEWPGILAWMIEGCRKWQAGGLQPPNRVTSATLDYFDDQDAVAQFLAEECETNPDSAEELATLFDRWRERCNAAGEPVGTQRSLSERLVAHGLTKGKHPQSRRVVFLGIRLKEARSLLAA